MKLHLIVSLIAVDALCVGIFMAIHEYTKAILMILLICLLIYSLAWNDQDNP